MKLPSQFSGLKLKLAGKLHLAQRMAFLGPCKKIARTCIPDHMKDHLVIMRVAVMAVLVPRHRFEMNFNRTCLHPPFLVADGGMLEIRTGPPVPETRLQDMDLSAFHGLERIPVKFLEPYPLDKFFIRRAKVFFLQPQKSFI